MPRIDGARDRRLILRVLLLAAIGGCGATPTEAVDVRASRPRIAAGTPDADELTGRALDEQGRPLEGVEVVMSPAFHCQRLMERAEVSERAVAEWDLSATVREELRVVRSDEAGRFAFRSPSPHACLLFVRPGYELRMVGPADSLGATVAPVELREAAGLVVDASCGDSPCDDVAVKMRCGASPRVLLGGGLTTLPVSLVHLPPGRCELRVSTRVGLPDERSGTATLTLVASERQSISLRLEPTGTGLAIEGRLAAGSSREPIRIYANCGEDPVVHRSVLAEPGQPFQVPNVGPPPCRVGYLVGLPDQPCAFEVMIERLPATVEVPAPACPPPPSVYSSE